MIKEKQTASFTTTEQSGKEFTVVSIVRDPDIKMEDCLMQSAFILDNGKRIIVYTSCWTGISSFQCDENWKPYPKPFATMPADMIKGSWTDYHLSIRKKHGEGKLVKEHSSKISKI